MNEDSHLEMDYEDRYTSDMEVDDEGVHQIWEVEPDECPYCETPMGLGHVDGCTLADPKCVSCETIGRKPYMKANRKINGRWYCFVHGMDIYCD